MSAGKYIKIDGVQLSVEWVNSMTKEQFIADAQVNRLFFRLADEDKANALSIIYNSIVGEKAKNNGGSEPKPPKDAQPVSDEK